MLPVSSLEGYCMIEMAADRNPPVQHRLHLSYQASQVSLKSIKKIAACFEHTDIIIFSLICHFTENIDSISNDFFSLPDSGTSISTA